MKILCFVYFTLGLVHAVDQTILFVDDHDILFRAGTQRILEKPVRHAANPLITEDKPWEMAIAWTSVHRDKSTGRYQLWYQAYAGSRAKLKTHECVVCYAESADGITFTKPNLGLFAFNEEENTNIVLIGSGVYGDRYCNSVIVDPKEPDASKRYKMLYYDWAKSKEGEVIAGLHIAFSPDGIRWTKHSKAPLYSTAFGGKKLQPPFSGQNPYSETKLSGDRVKRQLLRPISMSDAADPVFDPKRKLWAIYGKAWIPGPDGGLAWKHGMGRVESGDLLHWSKPQIVCFPDEQDGALEFHTSPVFFRHNRYFSLNQILNRPGGGTMDIELMISRDGLDWQRPFRKDLWLQRSPEGHFDSGTIATNSDIIIDGREMRFYYGAYSSGAIGGGTNITGDQQKSGVGMVSLPLDRFAGIRSQPEPATAKVKLPPDIGQITLKSISLSGRTDLYVNANALGGTVWCDILDEDGYRIPGFDKANCTPLKKDTTRFRLTWKGKKLSDLPAGMYLIRIHLQSAAVYAITLH
ncbi:MAG: hypothetical protein JNJ83_04590 [Verrucomicrobiaceae bacterium]|nr:hypothetical protein [Verrucomicrobiaceae bacterium]